MNAKGIMGKNVTEEKHFHYLDYMTVGVAHCEMLFDEKGEGTDYVHRYVNPSFERLTGFKNAVGKKISEILPRLRDSNSELFKVYARVASGGPPEEIKIYIPELEQWYFIRAYYFQAKNQFAVVFDNITKEKNDEEQLRMSEELFRFVIEQSPISIQILDMQGRTIKISKSFEKLWGLSLEDMQKYNILQDPQLERLGLATYIRRSFEGEALELPLREYDATDTLGKGYKRMISSKTYPIKDYRGKIQNVILMHEDVTERENAKKAIIAAKVAAEEMAQIKSRFLDMAAHELRTPVTAFSLLLQVTQKQLERGVPVDLSILKRLRIQSDRISNLVVDLLDVSRLERGTVVLKLELTDLGRLINECLDDFKLRDTDRTITFLNEQPFEVNIDSLRISQVINNILENARKYTPDGSPLEIKLERKGDCVRASFIDQGPGISKERQKIIFKPFARGSTELTSRSGGLGLGLYISSEIIKLHGGKLDVESEINKGSTFYFELPLKEKDGTTKS